MNCLWLTAVVSFKSKFSWKVGDVLNGHNHVVVDSRDMFLLVTDHKQLIKSYN